jgi:hypothetical protein
MRHCGQAALQAPVVSATKGTRHYGQATLVAVVQKGVDETAAQQCQKSPQQEDFFAGKAIARALNSMQRLTQLAAFLKQKSNMGEVKIACFYGAPLKRREE